MPFEFVNNASIDRHARKLIRSHAAKGQNVGKKRPSKRKEPAVRIKITLPVFDERLVPDAQGLENDKAIPPFIERQIGDGLSVLSIPAELTPRSKDLVQKGMNALNIFWFVFFADSLVVFSFLSRPLYPTELFNAIDFSEAPYMWIQFIFLDEACMIFSR